MQVTRRNIEKELVLARGISWKAAKTLTDTAKRNGAGSNCDEIFRMALTLHQERPEIITPTKRQLQQKSFHSVNQDDSGDDDEGETWC